MENGQRGVAGEMKCEECEEVSITIEACGSIKTKFEWPDDYECGHSDPARRRNFPGGCEDNVDKR